MPPARRQAIEKRFEESLAAVPLDALRKALEMTRLQPGNFSVDTSESAPSSPTTESESPNPTPNPTRDHSPK